MYTPNHHTVRTLRSKKRTTNVNIQILINSSELVGTRVGSRLTLRKKTTSIEYWFDLW